MKSEQLKEPTVETRLCLMCERIVRITTKIGPLEIKEPCPNRCQPGYARKWHKERQ